MNSSKMNGWKKSLGKIVRISEIFKGWPRDIDRATINAYLKDVISTKLVLATHTNSEKLLTQINYQLVYLMRFLDKTDIQPLLSKLAACYAFDRATVKLLEDLNMKASIYQLKVEIVSRLFWFLKAPYPYPYPQKVTAKLMEVI